MGLEKNHTLETGLVCTVYKVSDAVTLYRLESVRLKERGYFVQFRRCQTPRTHVRLCVLYIIKKCQTYGKGLLHTD